MPKKFSDFINESYKNLIQDKEKLEYVDIVWDLLVTAYASQGGLVGKGFSSKEDMIKNIHFWKLNIVHGKVKAVAMYRDKDGRKRVAIATDGTTEGKEKLLDLMVADLKTGRAYMEISGLSLRFIAKHLDLSKYAIKFDDVKKKMNGEEIRHPDEDDAEIKYHPKLKEYFYQREIGDHFKTKIMLGNINAESINQTFN